MGFTSLVKWRRPNLVKPRSRPYSYYRIVIIDRTGAPMLETMEQIARSPLYELTHWWLRRELLLNFLVAVSWSVADTYVQRR